MRPLVERPVPGLAVRPSTATSDGASTGAQSGWSELARASGNVFATPEFADASVAQLPDGADVHIRTVVDGDRPVAVVPLVLQRVGGLRIARLLGAPVADDLSPACAPEDRARAADEIRTAVAELGADVLFAERLPAEQGWAELLGGHELASDASPVIPIGGIEWSAYLGGRSSNFRQQVRRRTRALEGLGATYRLSDAASLDHDLETLFSLHRARWGGESTTFTECEPFHRAFAPVALSRGWLRLWLLEVDDEPVAATYGFRFGSSESYYQSGRSPKWNKMSPGLVLLAHAVRSAMEEGMAEFRLLRGNESHKGRFTDQGLTLVSLGVGLTALGRVAVAAAPHLPRRWLRRFA
jgi:CelD/BcsL family acetyltransferase involved in cellulose biosynthesis